MAVLLSKKERAVMGTIFRLGHDTGKVLISAEKLMQELPLTKTLNLKNLKPKHDAKHDAAAVETQQVPTLEDVSTELDNVVEMAEVEPIETDAAPMKKERRDKGKAAKDEKVAKKEKRSKVIETESVKLAHAPKPPKVYVDPEPFDKGLFTYKKVVTYRELKHIVKLLQFEEYYELTEADSDDGDMYVFTFKNKGFRYDWEERDRVKRIYLRMALMVGTPIVTFVVGMLLNALVKK